MILIKKAEQSDFDGVYTLLRQLWPKGKLIKNTAQKMYKERLKNPYSISFVAVEGKIIGYASGFVIQDYQSNGDVALLTELVVDEVHRNNGLGKKLLRKIIKEAKKYGCKELQFSSNFKRKRAHKFYESLGYSKTAYYFWKKI